MTKQFHVTDIAAHINPRLEPFSTDELWQEIYYRTRWYPDSVSLLNYLDVVEGVPGELLQPIREWLALPVANKAAWEHWTGTQ